MMRPTDSQVRLAMHLMGWNVSRKFERPPQPEHVQQQRIEAAEAKRARREHRNIANERRHLPDDRKYL